MLVIGKNPVLEYLKTSPREFNKIILLKTIKPEPRLKEIVQVAEKEGISVIYLNHFQFIKYFDKKNKEEGISQGVLGFIRDYKYKPLREILEEIKHVINPLIVLLD